MPLPHALVRLLAAAAVALAALPAAAWGSHGHQTVGGIADQLIAGTPAAKNVRAILDSSLQTASVWADCARSVEGKAGQWIDADPGTDKDCAVDENPASQQALIAFVRRNASRCGDRAPSTQCRHEAWHFTDIPIQRDAYTAGQPGTAPNDLVQAVGAAITVPQGGKPPPAFRIASQREALRLLVHFVGDLHQPLHVGAVYLDDQGRPVLPRDEHEARAHDNAGGNAITLGHAKLHALWDDVPGPMRMALLGGDGVRRARQVPATAGPPAGWPVAWAGDTLRTAPRAFQGLKIGARTDQGWPASAAEPAYRKGRENLQQAQLVKAGARLAQLLTTLWP